MKPDLLFRRLNELLKVQLPGRVSHLKMLPEGRVLEPLTDRENYRECAVLLLLFPLGEEVQISLIRRPSTMKNHAGQIAFPGGKREQDDVDLVHTALREAREEIGLDHSEIRILGTLTPVYVEVSQFLITPILGWVSQKPEIVIDPSEVDEVIFISLSDVVNEICLCNREAETRTGRISVPGYEIGECFIWLREYDV